MVKKKLDESVEFVYGANGNVVKTIEGWSSEYNGEWKTDWAQILQLAQFIVTYTGGIIRF